MDDCLFKAFGYLHGLLLLPRLERAAPIRLHGKIRIYKRFGSLAIGRRTTLWPGIKISIVGQSSASTAHVIIGAGSSIGDRTEIHCCERVTIGNNVLVSWDVVFLENNYHTTMDRSIRSAPITIEDNVWIGCRSIIIGGVTIGRGSIIGAGSVVTRDVPPGHLAVGNPARIIRETAPVAP